MLHNIMHQLVDYCKSAPAPPPLARGRPQHQARQAKLGPLPTENPRRFRMILFFAPSLS